MPLTIVTFVVLDRLRSCKKRVSRVFGAKVSFKKAIRAEEAASVWIFLRFRWYCDDVLDPCLEEEWEAITLRESITT